MDFRCLPSPTLTNWSNKSDCKGCLCALDKLAVVASVFSHMEEVEENAGKGKPDQEVKQKISKRKEEWDRTPGLPQKCDQCRAAKQRVTCPLKHY